MHRRCSVDSSFRTHGLRGSSSLCSRDQLKKVPQTIFDGSGVRAVTAVSAAAAAARQCKRSPCAAAMAQSRANHVVGFTPSTITICLSDGSFVCGISQRCDSGLYRAQLDIVLPARDKAPTVRAFLSHIQSKEWGRYLQTGLVCFRGQSQLDWSDPATVLVGGTIDILSVQEARERACSS